MWVLGPGIFMALCWFFKRGRLQGCWALLSARDGDTETEAAKLNHEDKSVLWFKESEDRSPHSLL